MFRTPQVILFSPNLPRAVAFYASLGFRESFRVPAEGDPIHVDLTLDGYKIGIARRNRRSFAVIQPHYRKNDANCCPSSFRIRRYTWTGERFKAGKLRKRKTAPRRFYD